MISDIQKCTGCMACMLACPQKCIHTMQDHYGFLYPVIDKAACVACGICETVCSINKPLIDRGFQMEVYAAYVKDNEVLKESSSGGIFSALAQSIFARNGVVYGCAWDENLKAVHIRISNQDELWKLRRSKYVQSDIGNTYQLVHNDLQAGLPVLYSGTPCQIHGLQLFLGRHYDLLYTIDLVCHGVPSPVMFNDYVSWLNKKNCGQVVFYNFRHKHYRGWYPAFQYSYIKNSKLHCKYLSMNRDPYNYYFLEGSINRECCSTCKYAVQQRAGDFSLGDYWGVEHFHPEIPMKQGVSVLFINSIHAKRLLEQLHDTVCLVSSTKANASKYNRQLNGPTHSLNREIVMESWRKYGFKSVNSLFMKQNWLKNSIGDLFFIKVARKVLNICCK